MAVSQWAQQTGPTAGLRSRSCATTMLPMRQKQVYRAFPPAWVSASQSKNRGSNMSRHWHRVSKPLQKLAAGLHPIMTEGMSPYELYYVLATDEEIQRLGEMTTAMGTH